MKEYIENCILTYPEKTFAFRAERYAKAMNVFGHSRLLELEALAKQIKPTGGTLLDLMSGSGFVGTYLGEGYHEVHGMDITPEFQVMNSRYNRLFTKDVGTDQCVKETNSAYDTIICHAGFHHLLPSFCDSSDHESVTEFRVQCLRRWRSFLLPGGQLIVGDVPKSNTTYEFKVISKDMPLTAFPILQNAIAQFPAIPVNMLRDMQIEPAHFFDFFVQSESITPHVARFESKDSLATAFSAAGFVNVTSEVYTVPWFFENLEQAVWFMHNLFGIQPYSQNFPCTLNPVLKDKIITAINKYLGLIEQEGACWIGWKLLYTSGEVPA